ncbi:MAG TPA: molybdate ABC transporter substrate-binding protein [Candidatus Binatia bacterium]|nr:molybdate ABC transporter substrate-binding protein [Candidatus Binatia bacterium]
MTGTVWRWVGLAVCLLLAASRGTVAAGPRTFTVLGAADLAFAFKEIVPRFEQATGAEVTLVLGSSGNLAKQVASGMPADVFFSADQRFIDDLIDAGHAIRETRAVYAQGRIVLATAKAFGPKLTELRELADPRVRRVAIANPRHAPYGRAAEEALRAVGLWETLRPKLVYGENIRHTLQFLQTGAVDAGIVALSVADVPEVEWVLIDAALHAPLDQAVAVLRRSRHPELALEFIRFVNGPVGRPIMKRYGFRLPGEF